MEDGSGAIVAVNNQIKIVNNQGAIGLSYNNDISGCYALAIRGGNLIAFYNKNGVQSIYHFEIVTSTIQSITKKGAYPLGEEHVINYPAQVAIHVNDNKIQVLILDSNQAEEIAYGSYIKLFQI